MVLSAGALAGCEIGYIARAAYEESLPVVAAKADRHGARARRPAARSSARVWKPCSKCASSPSDRLGLNVGHAYTSISEVDKGAIAWVVMAAPRDSLEPYTWWFPIVGRIPYRGYFNKDHADAEAAEMEQRGYDTMVRPAVAFSSLGFFNDPLLSNLLRLAGVELAGVIIHELFHRTYFLASDVMFDESAATLRRQRGRDQVLRSDRGARLRRRRGGARGARRRSEVRAFLE